MALCVFPHLTLTAPLSLLSFLCPVTEGETEGLGKDLFRGLTITHVTQPRTHASLKPTDSQAGRVQGQISEIS